MISEPLAFGLLSSKGNTANLISEITTYNLGVGEPLLSQTPEGIYSNAFNKNNINLYYPAFGDLELRLLILKKYYPELSTECIAITNGAIGAIDFVLRALRCDNAEILLPDPGFPPYKKLADFSSYKTHFYKIDTKNSDIILDWNSIFDQVNENTKIILLNSPHNPTGKIMSKDDLAILIKLLDKYKTLSFIMDEVYRDLVYENIDHVNLTKLIGRGYIIGSFSKVYPIQGARVGWVVTGFDNQKKLAPYFQNAYGSVSSFGQEIAKEFIYSNVNYKNIYEESRASTLKLLDDGYVNYVYPKGAFYFFIDIGTDDIKFSKYLASKGVIVIPGSAFGQNGKNHIRISFAQNFEVLQKAITIIVEAIQYFQDSSNIGNYEC
jgi:aspartate aminotransferase